MAEPAEQASTSGLSHKRIRPDIQSIASNGKASARCSGAPAQLHDRVRAEPYEYGDLEVVSLELYLTERARGMKIENARGAPVIRSSGRCTKVSGWAMFARRLSMLGAFG
jgi:hypothetical protein